MAVVIREVSYMMAHVPDLVRYGSKPSRDLDEKPDLLEAIGRHLRTYDDVLGYAPHQAFIGNRHPDTLHSVPKPWYEHLEDKSSRTGPFGEIFPEAEFYAWLKLADDFDLLWLEPHFLEKVRPVLAAHALARRTSLDKLGTGTPVESIQAAVSEGTALPLFCEGKMVGSIRRDHDKDDSLKAVVLLENLIAKALGALAIRYLLQRADMAPADVPFVLDCTETAVGDRYNRGGGGLSKAMAEMCGCVNATGNDIRAFCCGPNHAIINAAGLVESGICRSVVVAGGGCLAKVGMKYSSHLKSNMPILEDVVAGLAILVTKDDGISPVLRLDSIGKHDVGAGSAQQAIMTSLVVKPLDRLGLKMTDVDKYSTELHNPEITLSAGSGDTPATNYKIIAALATLKGQIARTEMDDFVRQRGMPGYCPTQGHVPSAVPFLGHALLAMRQGQMQRAMFVAKGSLFLGRMSQLADGVSFLLEANASSLRARGLHESN